MKCLVQRILLWMCMKTERKLPKMSKIPSLDQGRMDRLCGLVVRVLGYRSGGPGSIPGTTKKKFSGSGTGSTQPQLRSYLIEK
jgi:hypothetical protein